MEKWVLDDSAFFFPKNPISLKEIETVEKSINGTLLGFNEDKKVKAENWYHRKGKKVVGKGPFFKKMQLKPKREGRFHKIMNHRQNFSNFLKTSHTLSPTCSFNLY